MGLLKAGVSSRRIATLARQRGIGFKLTPEVENQLRRAGADVFILETLRELSPIPLVSPAAPAQTVQTGAVSPPTLSSPQDSKPAAAESRSNAPPVAPVTAADHPQTHAPPATAYEEPSVGLKGAAGVHQEAAGQNPQSAEAHISLGLALVRKGDWAGAIAEDWEAIRLDPNDAAAHQQLGSALMQKDDWSGAIAEEQEAVRLDASNADAHFDLGLALIHQKDWDDAVTEERAVINLRPDDAVAHCKLGLAYRRVGDYVKAGSEEREAIRLKPDLAEAHFILGVVLEWQGDLAGALAECQKATELDPAIPSSVRPPRDFI